VFSPSSKDKTKKVRFQHSHLMILLFWTLMQSDCAGKLICHNECIVNLFFNFVCVHVCNHLQVIILKEKKYSSTHHIFLLPSRTPSSLSPPSHSTSSSLSPCIFITTTQFPKYSSPFNTHKKTWKKHEYSQTKHNHNFTITILSHS